jgi:hypothetical protein
MLRCTVISRWMVLSASLVMAACDDSEEPSVLRDASFATPSDASVAGDAGAAGDASAASDASRADASSVKPPAPPVMCGGKTCTAPQGGPIPNVACCLPDNSCGATPDLSGFGMGVPAGGGGACLDVTPGTPDPSCPSQMAMGFPLNGCCSKAGVCGLDLSMGGLGCNAISAFGALGSLGGGMPMDAGPPQKCGSGAGDAGVDAGPAVDAAAPRDASAADAADGSSRDR